MVVREVRELGRVGAHGLHQQVAVVVVAMDQGRTHDVRGDAVPGQAREVGVQHLGDVMPLRCGAVLQHVLHDEVAEGVAAKQRRRSALQQFAGQGLRLPSRAALQHALEDPATEAVAGHGAGLPSHLVNHELQLLRCQDDDEPLDDVVRMRRAAALDDAAPQPLSESRQVFVGHQRQGFLHNPAPVARLGQRPQVGRKPLDGPGMHDGIGSPKACEGCVFLAGRAWRLRAVEGARLDRPRRLPRSPRRLDDLSRANASDRGRAPHRRQRWLRPNAGRGRPALATG
mmetsp:Transcript_4796/g.13297  ORF Transcript_4796/g.13297 Transcript_4796/m.13297 type:complete len:285 (-) Transcript_4796:558-1412(-)